VKTRNPQRLHVERHESGEDIVRTAWRHAEAGGNILPTSRDEVTSLLVYQRAKKGTEHALDKIMSL